mmetsp:Transcript_2634/g.8137  ORF Transcript_2634/g.8137 Transcript_2634/m.8137 type:complete len:225 (-) Transcript_2634:755-1429(-)
MVDHMVLAMAAEDLGGRVQARPGQAAQGHLQHRQHEPLLQEARLQDVEEARGLHKQALQAAGPQQDPAVSFHVHSDLPVPRHHLRHHCGALLDQRQSRTGDLQPQQILGRGAQEHNIGFVLLGHQHPAAGRLRQANALAHRAGGHPGVFRLHVALGPQEGLFPDRQLHGLVFIPGILLPRHDRVAEPAVTLLRPEAIWLVGHHRRAADHPLLPQAQRVRAARAC